MAPTSNMKRVYQNFALLGLSSAAAVKIPCSSSAIQSVLPAYATVDFAEWQPANSTFQVPSGDIAYPESPTQLKAACAVQIRVRNEGSNYGFGVFLPEDWNGRFLAVGNGGFAGGINWADMAAGLGYGFASMSTDTGHNSSSGDGTWAYNNENALLDWGYRAMHGSVVLAKQLTTGIYGKNLTYSYYSGCSTGGRQGLRDIQLYPEDFDGVVAGAPAWWTSHLQTWTVKVGTYNLPNTSDHHIPVSLFSTIGAEVLRQCDMADGVNDTIISDPKVCDFNMDTLLCGLNSTESCLTPPQLDTLSKIYNDYVDVNQTFVFPHLWMGSEDQWPVLLGVQNNEPNALGMDYVQDFLGNGPNWSWQDFDYGIIQEADAKDPGNATADDFAMQGFRERGGKLLHYHGMADGLIATGSSEVYYSNVLKALKPQGIELDDFYRFFLVPGMQHCQGTPTTMNAPWYFAGANQAAGISTSLHSVPGYSDAKHDVLLAMMAWVENGTAPDSIIATKWQNDTLQDEVYRQRPLCMFPKRAMYDGTGDVDAADSWSCA